MLKKFIYKKALSVLLASVFIVSSGCGTKTTTSTTEPNKEQVTKEEATTTTQESNEKVKLVIGLPAFPTVIDFNTNKLTSLIEEKNNVDLEFLLLPADAKDYKTKVSLMVSSQSKLPDVLIADGVGFMDELSIMDYGNKGVFIDLTSYLNDPEITPNFNSVPDDIKKFVLDNTKLLGKNYAIAKYNPQYWNEGFHRAWVNKEWMADLGIEEPSTTEEFREMLKKFATEDPNGNGKKDEIALVGNKYDSGWGNQVNDYIMGAFTYANPDKAYLHIKDGKIYPSYTQEGWKEGIEYMNSLVNEGLLSPLSYTQDNNQLKALAGSELAVTGVVVAGSASTFGAQELPSATRMNLLRPLEGPKGEKTVSTTIVPPANQWFVTKDCANPEVAVKVGDTFWDYEIAMMARFGERGINWEDNPELTKLWAPEQEGHKVEFYPIPGANIWQQPQNTMWQGLPPNYISLETALNAGFVPLDELATTTRTNYQPTYTKEYAPFAPKENIMRIVYSPEDLDKISSNKTAIDNYVKTSLAEFVTGTRPISDWDKYLKELDNMGLTSYIETAQEAYDRNK